VERARESERESGEKAREITGRKKERVAKTLNREREREREKEQ